MSYIGSNPITQYFKEGADNLAVVTSQSVFTLSRPVTSISNIEVSVGGTYLAPVAANYSVSGNQLNLASAVSNTTVVVRYLTASNYSVQVSPNLIPVSSLMTAGNLDGNSFLRADGTWARIGIPQNLQSGAYTVQETDNGFHILMTDAGGDVTIPVGLPLGFAVTVINYLSTATTINILPASGVVFTQAGNSGAFANIALTQYSLATLLCINAATNTFLVTGAGNPF